MGFMKLGPLLTRGEFVVVETAEAGCLHVRDNKESPILAGRTS